MNQETIGKFIAKLRKERNMTQKDLGDILGVSYKAVSKWERGISLPEASLYNEICKTFGITKDELFAGKKIKIKLKKYFIILITIIIVFLIIIFVTTPKFYKLSFSSNDIFNFRNTGGILVNGFSRDAFQLTISLNNPDNICTIGLFIKNNDKLELLETYGNTNEDNCVAFRTEDGYANTTETFTRIEKYFENGNIISKMLKNKDNTYLCVSNRILENLPFDDCYKINFMEMN